MTGWGVVTVLFVAVAFGLSAGLALAFYVGWCAGCVAWSLWIAQRVGRAAVEHPKPRWHA